MFKKSMLVLVLVLVVFSVSCKKSDSYDIEGTWSFSETIQGSTTFSDTFTYTFRAGIVYEVVAGIEFEAGSYSVSGSSVSFNNNYYFGAYTVFTYNGEFSSDNSMSGDVSRGRTGSPWPGTWTANRR